MPELSLSILQESGRPPALTTLTAPHLLQLLLVTTFTSSLSDSFTNPLSCLQVMSTQLDTLQVSPQPPVPTTLTATS